MHQSWRVAISLSAVMLFAACCSMHAVGAKVSEDFERSLNLEDGGEVAVANTNGSVQVNVTDGSQVLLRATKTARETDDLDRIRIEVDESPGRIEIETKIPRSVRNAAVSYDLEVPRGTRVEATSVNGSIRIVGTRDETTASTVNGPVNITEVRGSVTAKTVNGSLQVNWASLEGSAKNSLETVNGSLRIWMPSDTQGAFKASTVNGSIKTDLPLEVRKRKFGRRPSIDDRIGEGGPDFSLSTVHGSISILEN